MPRPLYGGMGRARARRRLVRASLALLVFPAGAAALSSVDGTDEQRAHPRTPVASPLTRTRPRQPSPVRSTPPGAATVLPEPPVARARAREFVTRYLAVLHGRGSLSALRPVAARPLLRELRRSHPRVTPWQHQTRSRILDLSAPLRSPGSVRAVATLKGRGGLPYLLQLYLERRDGRWVVTRLGDA